MRSRRLLLALAIALIAAAVPTITYRIAAQPLGDDQYTLLVIGSDQGPWRNSNALEGRGDALHLISVVPSQRSASILSFPRDSYVSVPGMGTTRINAGLVRGPENMSDTVESLTGIDIDDWILTSMAAFKAGIEESGGVTVNVPQNLQVGSASVAPGEQLLMGAEALVYARDRKNRSNGDFGRNQAQAELLALLHAQHLANDPNLLEVMDTIRILRRSTVTSIPATRMPILAKVAMEIDPDKVVRRQVPGSNANRGGASVVVLGSGAEALYADLRDDGLFTP